MAENFKRQLEAIVEDNENENEVDDLYEAQKINETNRISNLKSTEFWFFQRPVLQPLFSKLQTISEEEEEEDEYKADDNEKKNEAEKQ
ncbi:unnamed protein product [Caenorhabditis angaria]|uniref:Uncharacterized protein n=1 Tax=Caenorhabditis angaria TaxID=860376 RepID=A0A9P1J6J1_9PELO|nr:unnamed protein product [Caenorhabditis angaria]